MPRIDFLGSLAVLLYFFGRHGSAGLEYKVNGRIWFFAESIS